MSAGNDRKAEYIYSLAGIKAICLLLLFWWHSSLPLPGADLGARTCEFLFLASGFLVAYNYYKKDVPATWKESFRYVLVKLKRFWPLHFLTMVMVLFLEKPDMLSGRTIINMILNLSLLQAWSLNSEVYYSFNGVSWFLSDLMFCYFLSPVLLKIVKSVKRSYFLLALLCAIRLLMEIIAIQYPGEYFNIRFHTYPLVRAIEFFIGMSMVPICMKIKPWVSRISCFAMSIVEIAAIAVLTCASFMFSDEWPRAYFVLLVAVMLFVFSFDKGICSKALAATPLKWLSSIQFEFFLLHTAMMKCFGELFSIVFRNVYIANAAMLAAIIAVSILYKRFLEERCANLFERIVNNVILNFLRTSD